MSKKNHNPTPWKIAEGMRETIVDAQNTVVANAANGKAAEFIVDAVNAHAKMHEVAANLLRSRDAAIEDGERLRDLVRRLLPLSEIAEKYADADAEAIKGICALKGVDSSMVDAIRAAHADLLREAREAIGEDEE